METSDRSAVVRRLAGDPFRHLMTLKMLTLYPQGCRSRLVSDGEAWICRTDLEQRCSPWDARSYPAARLIVMIDGNSRELFGQVIGPVEEHAVYKVHDTWCRRRLQAAGHHLANAFLSFTVPGRKPVRYPAGSRADPVAPVTGYQPAIAALVRRNGYTEEELRRHLSGGGVWFAVPDESSPRAACIVFPNFGDVWEIGGVYTDPAYRRQGLAATVVRSALSWIAGAGLVPRYQCSHRNGASIALARSLGMRHALTVYHLAARQAAFPRAPGNA